MTPTQRKALEDAQQYLLGVESSLLYQNKALDQLLVDIKTALAEPEQEPSHWATKHGHLAISVSEMEALGIDKSNYVPLYTSPQPREWQELSEQEYINCLLSANISESVRMTREVGPYSITEPTAPANWLYKNISAALRAKNEVKG